MTGQEIKALRKSKGWSQRELAEHLGTTIRTIWRWEHDKYKPLPIFQVALNKLREEIHTGGLNE